MLLIVYRPLVGVTEISHIWPKRWMGGLNRYVLAWDVILCGVLLTDIWVKIAISLINRLYWHLITCDNYGLSILDLSILLHRMMIMIKVSIVVNHDRVP